MHSKRGGGLNVEKVLVFPPDGGWGWVVVGSAFYCILVMDGISNSFTLFIPIFEKEFNASVSEVSLINSLFTGFYFIFAPVAGSLSNRFGFRAIIIAGSIISSVGIAVTIFTNNVELMSATYGLVGGLGFSMMYINVVLTVGFYFEKWRALATGITVSASGVGTLSFSPLVQFLLQKYPWRHIFIGYACLVFSCVFVAICFRPLPAVALEEPEMGSLSELPGAKTPMHNTKYPTAAEALDLNLNTVNDGRINPQRSWYSSIESFELLRYNPSRKTSRNVEMRRHTEYSLFESLHDLTTPGTSAPNKRRKFGKKLCPLCRCIRKNHCLLCPCSCKKHCPLCRCSCKKHCPLCRCSCKKLRPLWRCSCKNRRQCCEKRAMGGVRPMYRDDIFYEGSLVQLTERTVFERNSAVMKSNLRSSSATKLSVLYHLSVSRLPTRKDLEEETDGRCHLCPESTIRALKTMFDFRVMKYPLFLLFTLSTCFLAAGVNVPTYFTYVRATEMGVMNEKDGSLILTAMGVTNTIGRIICGLLGSVPKVNMIILHFGFLLFGALLNVCIVFFYTKEAYFVYAALFGFVMAEQGSLRSVILVQLVGLQNLTNAFGILLLFLGLFTIVGTPAAAYMKDLFGTYDAVFFFSSVFLILAAVTLIPLFWTKTKFKGVQTIEVPVTAQSPAPDPEVTPSGEPATKSEKNEEE